MKSIGWLKDEAKRLERKIARLEAAQAMLWDRHTAEIDKAEQFRAMANVLQSLRDTRANINGLHDR